jgi:hypothetical protein
VHQTRVSAKGLDEPRPYCAANWNSKRMAGSGRAATRVAVRLPCQFV